MLLEPILRLLIKYVSDPRFGTTVAYVAGLVIGELVHRKVVNLFIFPHRHVSSSHWTGASN